MVLSGFCLVKNHLMSDEIESISGGFVHPLAGCVHLLRCRSWSLAFNFKTLPTRFAVGRPTSRDPKFGLTLLCCLTILLAHKKPFFLVGSSNSSPHRFIALVSLVIWWFLLSEEFSIIELVLEGHLHRHHDLRSTFIRRWCLHSTWSGSIWFKSNEWPFVLFPAKGASNLKSIYELQNFTFLLTPTKFASKSKLTCLPSFHFTSLHFTLLYLSRLVSFRLISSRLALG